MTYAKVKFSDGVEQQYSGPGMSEILSMLTEDETPTHQVVEVNETNLAGHVLRGWVVSRRLVLTPAA